MNSKSRTQYSAYNTSIALFSRAAAILMGYVVRVVFTHVLSENYVGINGLFTDILNVLSLSEMGIETAISFALYKPIADGNTEAQKSIMHLYQWFYRFVAVFVAAASRSGGKPDSVMVVSGIKKQATANPWINCGQADAPKSIPGSKV